MTSRIVSRIIVALVAVVLVGASALVGLSATGVYPRTPTGTLDPSSYVAPPPAPQSPAPGLPAPDATAPVDATAIKQGIDALDRSALGTVSYCVTDLAGDQVAGEDTSTDRTPASSWKLFTSLAVLSAYGADHRFATTVVASPTGVVLVGGGDPFLTAGRGFTSGQANANDLADQVAKALKAANRTRVTLGYDDSLFAGPQWSPAWPADYGADIAPISALSIDANGYASDDTSLDAATLFEGLLADRGITVTTVRVEHAASGAATLGTVQSLPLGQIVQRVLEVSDNFGAEVLFRHVGVAGGGNGSFTSGQVAETAFLKAHGLWATGMAVSDGSGLSLYDAVPSCILASAVRLAYDTPGLADIVAGLPVAGVDGTLATRFSDPDEASGRGVVRAKTGTHDYVRTMTGLAQTSDGAILFFSFMLNNLTDHPAGINWIDEAASVIASS